MKKILFLLPLALTLCACESDPKEVTFTLKEFNAPVDIHSEHQKAFLDDENYNNIGKYAAYASKESYADAMPINLSWDVNKAKKYVVSISENSDFSHSINLETYDKQVNFYNAKINTKYYWKVKAIYKNVEFTSEVASFTTVNQGPRNLFIDGVDNFRDIGGYVTEDDTLVKQGMVFRSGEFNKASLEDMQLNISNDGLSSVKQLGIKTDIDLRTNYVGSDGKIENSGIKVSPLGADVKYVSAPMYSGGVNFLENPDPTISEMNLSAIVNVFNVLGDANNYPVVFHCVQGKNRTGLIAYLLEGLLGMNETDIYRDYLFTNFCKYGGGSCKVDKDIQQKYGLTISKMEGSTLSQKVNNYLVDVLHIDQTTINNVVDILTE